MLYPACQLGCKTKSEWLVCGRRTPAHSVLRCFKYTCLHVWTNKYRTWLTRHDSRMQNRTYWYLLHDATESHQPSFSAPETEIGLLVLGQFTLQCITPEASLETQTLSYPLDKSSSRPMFLCVPCESSIIWLNWEDSPTWNMVITWSFGEDSLTNSSSSKQCLPFLPHHFPRCTAFTLSSFTACAKITFWKSWRQPGTSKSGNQGCGSIFSP